MCNLCWELVQVAVMCEIAEACLRANPRERPSMLDVIRTLSAVSSYTDSSRKLTYAESSQPAASGATTEQKTASLAASQSPAATINARASAASPAKPANAAAVTGVSRPPRSPAQNESAFGSGAAIAAAAAAASSPGPSAGRPSSSRSDGAGSPEIRAASMNSLGTRLRSSGKTAQGHMNGHLTRSHRPGLKFALLPADHGGSGAPARSAASENVSESPGGRAKPAIQLPAGMAKFSMFGVPSSP